MKKKSAIFTADSTRTRAMTGSISGPRRRSARIARRPGRHRRATIAQRPVRQAREGGDLRRHVVEDRPRRGVLARQAETPPQIAQDAPGRIGLAARIPFTRPADGAPMPSAEAPRAFGVLSRRTRR